MRLILITIAIALSFPPVRAATPEAIDFNNDIRPILSDACYTCHGPDDATRVADLRLDIKEGAFADRGGSAVIVPDNAAGSRLYQRISHEQEIARMPPPASERKLTAEQIDKVKRWIDEGAKWESHWAYVAPEKAALPPVSDESWVRNPIDRFILARLDREGLKPSREADRATLLRRLSFDLSGLPPTSEQIEAFVNDRSPDAYEKQIERLMSLPSYGERMAMMWLDLARYADTNGYHIDNLRDMWAWRDWVIQAYNGKKRFDEFTIEQLAGDLLPAPTRDQLVATGFNRNHMINFEGGAIPEEYRTEYVVNRVDTTATVWMGMTMGCARCHDHKYDPIKQKEFYRFFAFFNTIPEKGLDYRDTPAGPFLNLYTPEQQRLHDELESRLKAAEKALPEDEVDASVFSWEKTARNGLPTPADKGLVDHFDFEESLGAKGGVLAGEPRFNSGKVGKAVELADGDQISLDATATLDSGAPFTLALWMKADLKNETVALEKFDPESGRGLALHLEAAATLPHVKGGQRLSIRLAHRWPEDAIEVRTKEHLVLRDWHHLTLSYDGLGKASGVRLLRNGEPFELEVLRDSLSGSFATTQPLESGADRIGERFTGSLDDLRIFDRILSSKEAQSLAIHNPIRDLLADSDTGCEAVMIHLRENGPSGMDQNSGEKTLTSEEKSCKSRHEALRNYYLTYDARGKWRRAHAEKEVVEKKLSELADLAPGPMVMREMKEPRETHMLGRGDYRNQGEVVEPGVPAVLPPLPAGAAQNRLSLANWLVSGKHPLTARVEANRYWQMFFGTGLVETAEDFGSQGSAPTHPKLLDWLAVEFVESGWDIQHIQRVILASAAYRQDSRATPELIERDPQNRLLARGPRFRLPAEMVRDNALKVSGLLEMQIGGPSVYTYQPPGLWEEMAFGGNFSGQEYMPGEGDELYRRSLYTIWKRTVPPAMMSTFDAPDRETCTVRRARTNTPLQALALLNDTTFVEASRAFAERLLTEGGDSEAGRIRFAYHEALGRAPSSGEMDVLLTLLNQQEAEFHGNSQAARDLVGVGESRHGSAVEETELAAWTLVASTILNLDEAITKE